MQSNHGDLGSQLQIAGSVTPAVVVVAAAAAA